MPHCTSIIVAAIRLNLSTKKVRWTEANVLIDTTIPHKAGKVEIHNMGRVPPAEQSRFDEPQLVVAHLIVRHEHGARTGPSALRVVGEDFQGGTLAGLLLVRDAGQHPKVIVQAVLGSDVEFALIVEAVEDIELCVGYSLFHRVVTSRNFEVRSRVLIWKYDEGCFIVLFQCVYHELELMEIEFSSIEIL